MFREVAYTEMNGAVTRIAEFVSLEFYVAIIAIEHKGLLILNSS